MEGKWQLCVLILHVHVSLAILEKITVMKGGTLDLNCSIKNEGHKHPVEWKNPDVHRNGRFSLLKLSESEYSIRVSEVTFSDGGRYTCSHFLHHTVEKTLEVTVLDRPRMTVTTHNKETVIKCAAEGNYPPPEISWRIKNGPEFHSGLEQNNQEDKKYVTTARLYIKPAKKAIVVKCIVRHPALLSLRPLMDFVIIRPSNNGKNRPETTTTTTTDQFPTTEKVSLTTEFSTAAPQFTSGMKTSTKIPTNLPEATMKQKTLPTTGELTSDQFSTTEKEAFTTEFSTTVPQFSTDDDKTTGFPIDTSQFNSEASTVDSTTERRILNTTGNWLTSAGLNISFNETKNNNTESGNDDVERQKGNEENPSLLVFLITCLILGLLVVVVFIGIKLRKAHIIWKRENDDIDTSESSSKSKSSQENKITQRRRGFFNTGLTQYVIQEPTVITVTNPAPMTPPENVTNEQNSPTQLPPQATTTPNVKETEL
ncbi:uncharacterized protein [Eucyclogobius newberryi]|uniref:uncharacterized protein n=1 Tax=Eucyclogobius newberryi TaxID=166745 RepID=UPI003B5CF613